MFIPLWYVVDMCVYVCVTGRDICDVCVSVYIAGTWYYLLVGGFKLTATVESFIVARYLKQEQFVVDAV